MFFHNEAQGGAWPQATAWPAARRARAPARPAAARPAPVPSAGGSRRTGPAPLGASFIYASLSKNAVNRGFLRFSKSMKCCQVLAPKGCDKFFAIKKRVGGMGIKYGRG